MSWREHRLHRARAAVCANVVFAAGTHSLGAVKVGDNANNRVLSVTGNYAQTAGTLEVSLAAGPQFGTLAVAGNAGFTGGTLTILVLPGYVPAPNDTGVVVTAGGNLNAAPLGGNPAGDLDWTLLYDVAGQIKLKRTPR